MASEELNRAFGRVSEEATKSVAYFHTWWGLSNRALPTYESTLTKPAYRAFFGACRSGFLALTFVSLSKLLDSDGRTLGLRRLREILTDSGFPMEAARIDTSLKPFRNLAGRILAIRNRAVSHNEEAVSRDTVFATYGVTPDEVSDLVEAVRAALNEAGRAIGWPTEIPSGERHELATLAMIERLAGDSDEGQRGT